ncbi:MAG TPA: DUF3592 domain-containing protein [Anaerolineae bacterium]|nr:DUF3592 domain-containing protein [Anaerolineae bacterium]
MTTSLIFSITWLICIIPIVAFVSLSIIWRSPQLAHLSPIQQRYWSQTVFCICLILAFGRDFFGIIGAIILGAGLLMRHFSFHNHQLGLASKKWPHVIGQISKSEIISYAAINDADSRYRLLVETKYKVDNQSFTTNCIAFGHYHPKYRSTVNQILQTYPLGKKVKVYYQPDQPSLSTLEQGTHYTQKGLSTGNNLLIIGTIFMLAVSLLYFNDIWEQLLSLMN